MHLKLYINKRRSSLNSTVSNNDPGLSPFPRFPGSYYPAAAIKPEQGNLAKAIMAVLHDCILLSRILRKDANEYHQFLLNVGPSRSRGMFLSQYITSLDLEPPNATSSWRVLTMPHPRWHEHFRKYGFDALVELVLVKERLMSVFWSDECTRRATISSSNWVERGEQDIVAGARTVQTALSIDLAMRGRVKIPPLPIMDELQRIVGSLTNLKILDVDLDSLFGSISVAPPQPGKQQILTRLRMNDELELLGQILEGIRTLTNGMHNSVAHGTLIDTLYLHTGGVMDASLTMCYTTEWGNLLLYIRDVVCGLLDGPSLLTYNTAVKVYIGMIVDRFEQNTTIRTRKAKKSRVRKVFNSVLDTAVNHRANVPYTLLDQCNLKMTVATLYYDYEKAIR